MRGLPLRVSLRLPHFPKPAHLRGFRAVPGAAFKSCPFVLPLYFRDFSFSNLHIFQNFAKEFNNMKIISENKRGKVDMGWLQSAHSFSFGTYYNPEMIHFGALRVLNDDHIKGGYGFPLHPHDNMEIITIVLNGTLEHKDTIGNKGVLLSGDVQLMGAGTGIFHSEANPDADNPLELLQIWVFPSTKGLSPSYQQKNFSHELTSESPVLLLGPEPTAPLQIRQKAWFTRWQPKSNNEFSYLPHEPSSGLYVFVIDGNVTVQEKMLAKRDALTIENLSNLQINVKASDNSDVLFMEVPMQW